MCKRKHNDLLRVVRNAEKVSNSLVLDKTNKEYIGICRESKARHVHFQQFFWLVCVKYRYHNLLQILCFN